MTSGICFKIMQEEGSGCGWGRIGHGLMVVGLCDGCLCLLYCSVYFGVCSKFPMIKCFKIFIWKHCFHDFVVVRLCICFLSFFLFLNFILINRSPQFTFGFIFDVVHSMAFDKYIMTCSHDLYMFSLSKILLDVLVKRSIFPPSISSLLDSPLRFFLISC